MVSSQISDPGDFFTHDIAGMPIVVIRGDDGEIRAFHNSCRHRGSMVATGEGSCKTLMCPYHNWTYGRDGKLVAEPVFGGSGLIFTLVQADGAITVPLDKGGLYAGEVVTVRLY